MSEAPIELSIVVPIYRSEQIVPLLVQQVAAALRDAGMDSRFELVLVDDASPDGSWHKIREMASQYAFVRGVSLARNFGQHNATMAGLHQARGEIVVIMDDDLQHPPSSIMALVDAVRSGHDVCYTNYVDRKHALWKRLGSRFNDRVASYLLKKPRGLYLSSFKAMHRRIVAQILLYDGPYAYIDGLILDATRSIAIVSIEHKARHAGSGNYGLRRSISLWLKMATSFSIVPLRIASLAGFALAGISALMMVAVVLEKLFHPETPTGWTSLATLILFMGGVQLLCLGIMGEYLGRAYLKLNHKPQFVVREKTKNTPPADRDG